jgi:hypothetical protein
MSRENIVRNEQRREKRRSEEESDVEEQENPCGICGEH